MRTEKLNFNKYAIIWANKILNNEEGYSLFKAWEIDPLFGELVEDRIKQLKRYERAKENIKTSWAYALILADKRLAEESEKLAEMAIETDLAMKSVESGNVSPEKIIDAMNRINQQAEQEIKIATWKAFRGLIKLANDKGLSQQQASELFRQTAEELKSTLDAEWEKTKKKTENLSQEELEKLLENVWGKDNND